MPYSLSHRRNTTLNYSSDDEKPPPLTAEYAKIEREKNATKEKERHAEFLRIVAEQQAEREAKAKKAEAEAKKIEAKAKKASKKNSEAKGKTFKKSRKSRKSRTLRRK